MKQKPSQASILLWEQLGELHKRGYQTHGSSGHIFPSIFKEYQFHDTRKWRFDFAINCEIGVEIDGGAWISGRHTRGGGFLKDLEKFNYAALLGYRILRFAPQQVLDGSAIAFIKRVLEA